MDLYGLYAYKMCVEDKVLHFDSTPKQVMYFLYHPEDHIATYDFSRKQSVQMNK